MTTNEPLTLTELIARLQKLAEIKGDYQSRESQVKFRFDEEDYYITGAMITTVDPDYNFDEANCGPDTEIELFYVGACNRFLSFLDTLESEKPNSTNWEQIEKRAKESEKALDYMREHPLTHEQAVEQAQRLKEEEKSTTVEWKTRAEPIMGSGYAPSAFAFLNHFNP